MPYRNPAANLRRDARNARVAAVKALGLKPGDWVATSDGRVLQATPSLLDARSYQYQWLKRALPTQIAAEKQKLAEWKRKKEEREQFSARQDVRDAGTILSRSTEDLLKLGPEFLAEIVRRLDAK